MRSTLTALVTVELVVQIFEPIGKGFIADVAIAVAVILVIGTVVGNVPLGGSALGGLVAVVSTPGRLGPALLPSQLFVGHAPADKVLGRVAPTRCREGHGVVDVLVGVLVVMTMIVGETVVDVVVVTVVVKG